MTPEEARKLLEEHIDCGIETSWEIGHCNLPVKDEVVLRESKSVRGVYQEWTFIGLLKIAYGL